MDDTWEALTRYKVLEDKITELKREVWLKIAPSEDIEISIQEAEEELEELKAWIALNYDTFRNN